VAPFLAQFGLAQADGSRSEWSRAWFDGNFESIFASPHFTDAAVHEGAPFWFPDFYRHLHHRWPGSRFVLMLADPDAWFRALLARSGGFAAGDGEVHAKVFRREDELRWLAANIPGFAGRGHLALHDSPAHYKAAYARHAAGVQEFFQARKADLLFVGRQDDPSSLHKLAEWLGLPPGAGAALASGGEEMPELTRETLLKPAVGDGSRGPR
jgi:hypothetical protein